MIAAWELEVDTAKRRPGSGANGLHERHGLDHRDAKRPYPVGGEIHYISRHRRGGLGQKHRDPVVLQFLEQVSDLPAILDADQGRH